MRRRTINGDERDVSVMFLAADRNAEGGQPGGFLAGIQNIPLRGGAEKTKETTLSRAAFNRPCPKQSRRRRRIAAKRAICHRKG